MTRSPGQRRTPGTDRIREFPADAESWIPAPVPDSVSGLVPDHS